MPTHRTVPPTPPPDHGKHVVAYARDTPPEIGCNCGDLFEGPDCVDQMATHVLNEMTQLRLPFLAPEDVATIDAARVAIDRAQQKAWMARRTAEADELGRLGEQLVEMLQRNAEAVRGAP